MSRARSEDAMIRFVTYVPTPEWELDENHHRTGRKRKKQFISYPHPRKRPKAPIIPWEFA